MTLLDALFAPLGFDAFAQRHLERAPLHLPGAAQRWSGLFSRRELARVLWQQGAAMAERVYAHRGGHTLYLPQAEAHDPWGWALRREAEGCSIVVNGVSQHCEPVARLCRALAERLGAEVSANAYLAPPGVPGYGLHFDTDDTLFLQVAGSKAWQLHEGPVRLPLREMFDDVDPAALGPAQRLTLEPGGLLYLPRGTVHTPVAGAQGSLHLTLGLRHVPVVDLVQAALHDLATRLPALHEPARPHDLPALLALLDRCGGAMADAPRLAALLQSLQRAAAGPAPPAELA